MPFDFSSDLDVGRRPELKSDEFSGETRLVLKIISVICYMYVFETAETSGSVIGSATPVNRGVNNIVHSCDTLRNGDKMVMVLVVLIHFLTST